MSDYVLSCCSTADLSKEHFEKRDIHYICFHFILDGINYPDDLGISVPFSLFYSKLKSGSDASTSQVNVDEYLVYFESFLREGKDILHVSLSSGISGTINSARIARDELAIKYPERKIYVIDSLAASSGYGLLMDRLADLRDGGMSVDELAEWTEKNKLRLHHWFFSTDLSFYIKGGRISKASGWFGTVLHICPLLNMDNLGRLIPRFKIRGEEAVIREIVKQMTMHADGGSEYSGKCYISNSDCIRSARAVAELVERKFSHLNGRVLINSVGTVIGAHTGPGTVALFFWGDERVD